MKGKLFKFPNIKFHFRQMTSADAVFLDVFQAFGKVWHEGLLHQIESTFPNTYYFVIKSLLENLITIIH